MVSNFHNRILQRSSSTILLVLGVVVVARARLAWGRLFWRPCCELAGSGLATAGRSSTRRL